jgi:hypothetical protein
VSWEPVYFRHQNGAIRDFYGIFCCDDYAPEPVAIFSTKDDAEEWLKREKERPEDDRQLIGDYCVSVMRGKPMTGDGSNDVMHVWNSYDPAPEDGP